MRLTTRVQKLERERKSQARRCSLRFMVWSADQSDEPAWLEDLLTGETREYQNIEERSRFIEELLERSERFGNSSVVVAATAPATRP